MLLNDGIAREQEKNISKEGVADVFGRMNVQFERLYTLLREMKLSGRKVNISRDSSSFVSTNVVRNVPPASGRTNKSQWLFIDNRGGRS